MKRFTFLSISLIFFSLLNAQQDTPWGNPTTPEKEYIHYDDISEADVMWAKRVWRIIDTREKMNLPFRNPEKSLFDIIQAAACSGDLTVYDNTVLNADKFIQRLNPKQVCDMIIKRDTIDLINAETLLPERKPIENIITQDKIIKYKVKEDWFFDEETSTMQVRIMGIAPVVEAYDSEMNYIGDETMYWIYYPDLRPFLSKQAVYNTSNDIEFLSWDNVFEARLFDSYIYKESNVYDRHIQDYASGLDALYESDRLQQKLFEFEHDLWSY